MCNVRVFRSVLFGSVAMFVWGCGTSGDRPVDSPPNVPVIVAPTVLHPSHEEASGVPSIAPVATTAEPVSALPQVPSDETPAETEKIEPHVPDYTMSFDEWDDIQRDSSNRAGQREKYDGKWIEIDRLPSGQAPLAYGFQTHQIQIGKSTVGPEFAVHTQARRPWLAIPLWARIKVVAQAVFAEPSGNTPWPELRNATWTIVENPEDAPTYEVGAFLKQVRLDPRKIPGEHIFAIRNCRVLLEGKLVRAFWFHRERGEIVLSSDSGELVSIPIKGDRVAEVMRVRAGEKCQVLVNCRFTNPEDNQPVPLMTEHELDGYLISPVRTTAPVDDDRLQAREVRDVRNGESTSMIDLSADGNQLLVIRSNYSFTQANVDVWNTVNGKRIADLTFENRRINWGMFLPNGEEVLLADYEAKEILRVNVATREIVETRPGSVPDSSLSPGRTLLTTLGDDELVVRNLSNGLESNIKNHGIEEIRVIVTSRDNQLLAASGYNGPVKIWNLESGMLVKEISEGLEEATNIFMSFAPDRSLFAMAYDDKVEVYDAKTFEKKFEKKEEYANFVYGLSFSGDAKSIIACFDSGNGTVRCWDIASGDEMIYFEGSRMTVDDQGTTLIIDQNDGVFRFCPITRWSEVTY